VLMREARLAYALRSLGPPEAVRLRGSRQLAPLRYPRSLPVCLTSVQNCPAAKPGNVPRLPASTSA